MSEKKWRLGRVCAHDEMIDLEKEILVAEVHSRALRSDDGGLVACYFLVDGLEPDEADRAMLFFSKQASLLVDTSRLVEDSGAEFPALVTIRRTEDAAGYLATADEYNFLRMLPDDDVISQEGWDIFCARDGLIRGKSVDDAEELPRFDYRALRRKIYANRALVQEDRSPWLVEEHAQLRKLTEFDPEGSEVFVAMADDMEAALDGNVLVGDSYSVVIPTKVERRVQDGALYSWIPQTGREIVVAHGLDPIQAARALVLVQDDPASFVSGSELLASNEARETLHEAFVVPDAGLNWISTDFSGKRSHRGYERLQKDINGARESVSADVVALGKQGSER